METVAPVEKLRTIEILDLETMSVPEKEPRAAQEEPAATAPPAKIEITVGECRLAALQNNLDLKVALVSPTIADETVNEEEARFEALLFSNLTYARTNTPTSTELDASKANILNADLGVRFPLRTGGTLTFDLPFNRVKTNNVFSTLNPSYTTDFAASISQPLLRGAGIRTNTHAIRIARYQAQIVSARTKLEVIRVIADVDRFYWRLYAARKELEVRKREHDLAVRQLERARHKVEAGTANEVEIIRAETGVAERLEAVIIAENNVRQTERDLKRALNMADLGMETPTIVVPATEPNPIHYNLDAAKLVKAAIDGRMEMLELEFQIAQDASTVKFRRNQALPALAVSYTYNVNALGSTPSDSYDLLLDKRFEDHRVGLELSVPLGNRAARSGLRRAVFNRAQRLATRESRRAQIQQEVLNTVDRIEANWQRVLANRHRTVLAARNLRAEERQFELGLRTSTDVLDVQTRLADAQSAEIRALVEYQIAQVDLAYATGTLLGAARVEWEPVVPSAETK